jgi:hypothetical protein
VRVHVNEVPREYVRRRSFGLGRAPLAVGGVLQRRKVVAFACTGFAFALLLTSILVGESGVL